MEQKSNKEDWEFMYFVMLSKKPLSNRLLNEMYGNFVNFNTYYKNKKNNKK